MPKNYARLKKAFKEASHLYNLRNGLICGSYKIKTVRYGTETITYLGPKIWSIIPEEIRESASLETFRQKIKLWKPDSYMLHLLKIHCKCWLR